MDEWKTFSGRLVWAMNRAGKTNQSELARAVGVKPQSIQYLCRPGAGAQGSTHTPALARALRVSAAWLAEGLGQPAALEQTGLALKEAAASPYVTTNQPFGGVAVKGVFKLSGDGQIEPSKAKAAGEGWVSTPFTAINLHAVKIKGQALAPYAKDGQFLLLQSAPDRLEPEDVIVIALKQGQTVVRELMHQRDGSLVVLPVLGGQPEVIDTGDVTAIELVVCVAARRWWQPV